MKSTSQHNEQRCLPRNSSDVVKREVRRGGGGGEAGRGGGEGGTKEGVAKDGAGLLIFRTRNRSRERCRVTNTSHSSQPRNGSTL